MVNKAVSISHHTAICNVLQLATFDGINMNLPGVEPRYRPGDVCTGGMSSNYSADEF